MLPLYAAYSLVRVGIAYILALLFALAYGFAAAKSDRAARVLLPLLDILQSIPVLSFSSRRDGGNGRAVSRAARLDSSWVPCC